MNKRWQDVEDYLEKCEFEDAGVAIGMIINEVCPYLSEEECDEITEAIHGEVV